MELAEVKLGAAHFLARNLFEKLPQPPLQEIAGATLTAATALDRNEGKFRDSANAFYSIYQVYEDPQVKLQALTGLIQQLINLHDFRKARFYIDQGRALSVDLSPKDNMYLLALRPNKLGWIADYEFGFEEAKRLFLDAEVSLNAIPASEWAEREHYLASDNLHWQGREACQLASVGIDREHNISFANQKLMEAIELDKEETEDQVGFGYLWLAGTNMVAGNYATAYFGLEECKNHFDVYLVDHPSRRDILAHYYLLRGHLKLAQSEVGEAETDFQQALEIRTGGDYSKGWADAQLSLAVVDIKRGNFPRALGNYLKAIQTNPYSAARVILGV